MESNREYRMVMEQPGSVRRLTQFPIDSEVTGDR